jgi:ribosomal protein S18 acetylase RimI-like enzyme
MEIQIRPAVATDISRMMGFDHTVTSDHVWQLDLRKESGQVQANFRDVRLPRSITVTYPRDPFALADDWSNRSAVLVASAEDLVIGYVCILEQNHATTAWVTDLVVNPDSRRQGVGSGLVQAAQDWAVSQGDRDIFLEMSSKNKPAINLAIKLGFEFCGYNDHYYVTQDVALFFGRSLL